MAEDSQKPKKLKLKRITLEPGQWALTLRRARQAQGLTIRQLADASSVSSSTIHRMEQGFYQVQLDKLLMIMDALDLVPTDVLLIDGLITQPPLSDLERQLSDLIRSDDIAGALRLLANHLDEGK